MSLLWMAAFGVLVVLLGGWILYDRYLHPAWRRQRRVLRVCEKAFEEGDYQVERFRVSMGEPGIADLVTTSLFGSGDSPRYFTYKIKTAEGVEPDFSGMDRGEIGLVRHYLRHNIDVPHYGKKMLRSRANESLYNDASKAKA